MTYDTLTWYCTCDYDVECTCRPDLIAEYRQCHLVKGNTHQTSWIPVRFAVVGKVLKLRDHDGNWDDGWKVESVGAFVRNGKYLEDMSLQVRQLPTKPRKRWRANSYRA